MSDYKKRQALISEIIAHRKRNVMTLVTSTKQPEQHFAAQIATDLLPVFYELLKEKREGPEFDL